MDKDKVFTTTELAKALGISRVAVFKKIKAGDIPAVQAGNSYVIPKDELPEDIKAQIREQQDAAAKRAAALATEPSKNELEFERELWRAADRLRGNIDASDYKHIVLGLLFLKYVSDSYYARREELEKLVADPKNADYYIPVTEGRKLIVDDKDQYKRQGVFYIPEKARWEYLRDRAMQPEIGRFIDEAMDAIEAENPQYLKGVLPKNYVRIPLESHILGELVNIFSRIKFNHDIDKEKDILGRVYEYFLGQFASAEGKRGGEFYTPRSIVRLLVEILEPFENSRVYDPACGSGGMFVQSSEFLKMHHKDPSHLSIAGQESNPTTLKLAKMNLALRGIFGQIELGNTYYEDKFPDLRADFVIANPPFNADWEPSRLSDADPRLRFGTPPKTNANYMWIQHFIHHLAPNGMAGFVMANGALAGGGREAEIRKKIIEADLVDVIVACPPKLFYNVALPVSLWFIAKNKASDRFRSRSGEILLIDATSLGKSISRKQIVLDDDDVNRIAETVSSWRDEAGPYSDIPGFCRAVKRDEVEQAGYVLTPGRYVGLADEEDDGVPFDEKLSSIKAELRDVFAHGDELTDEIQKILGDLR